ncbi:MAG: hypothetical protein GY739_04080 [Mesoflavibacter sp.]|nr:hypothetical protein [Mesoflavibacter sp.]
MRYSKCVYTLEDNDWLKELRNPDCLYPITKAWLKKLRILQPNDVTLKENIDWTFTPTLVSGHYERRQIIDHKIQKFGERYNEAILRWICPMKTGRKKQNSRNYEYDIPSEQLANAYKDVIHYFVRGAECVLSQKVHGFRKGTIGTYEGVVWEDEEHPTFDELPKAEISTVKQPKYIMVKVFLDKERKKTKIIPVTPQATDFEDKFATHTKQKVYKTMKRHPVDVTIAKTYHSTQGGTYKSIILSLNPCSAKTRRIAKVSITSMYVGLSRVHDFHEHRILPISEKELQKLILLKHDPLLKVFFNNYKNGIWQKGGLTKGDKIRKRTAKLRMGLIPLESITLADYQEFEPYFDIEVYPKTKPNYEKCLGDLHYEGKEIIEKNDACRFEAEKYYKEKLLKVKSIDNMQPTDIYYYGRRLGLKKENKNKMKKKLKTIYQQTKALRDVNMRDISIIEEDYDMLNTRIIPENTVNTVMDVENNQSDQDSDLSNHPSDQEIMDEMTHATYGKYCNESDEDIDLNHQSIYDHGNSDMNNDQDQCSCNCHNDKGEMDLSACQDCYH